MGNDNDASERLIRIGFGTTVVAEVVVVDERVVKSTPADWMIGADSDAVVHWARKKGYDVLDWLGEG